MDFNLDIHRYDDYKLNTKHEKYLRNHTIKTIYCLCLVAIYIHIFVFCFAAYDECMLCAFSPPHVLPLFCCSLLRSVVDKKCPYFLRFVWFSNVSVYNFSMENSIVLTLHKLQHFNKFIFRLFFSLPLF